HALEDRDSHHAYEHDGREPDDRQHHLRRLPGLRGNGGAHGRRDVGRWPLRGLTVGRLSLLARGLAVHVENLLIIFGVRDLSGRTRGRAASSGDWAVTPDR